MYHQGMLTAKIPLALSQRLFLARPLDGIQNLYRTDKYKFLLVSQHWCLRNSVSSTETDINTQLAKAWTAIDRLSVIWKSNLTDKIKCSSCIDTAV